MLTKKKKIKIAKMLAAIYYTAVHWRDEEWEDFVKCIVGNCAEIAFEVGGEPKTYYCPVCGEETDTYYKDKDGVIVGCDSCIVPVEAWEVEE